MKPSASGGWPSPGRTRLRGARDRRHAEKIGRANANVGRELREAARLPAVNARGRLISGLVTTVMALAGFVTAGVLPAAAAPSTVQYVALGDSYAAGTASQLGGCPHGPDNYPELLDGSEESRIDLTAFAACSGWRTSDVLDLLDDDGQPSPLSSHTRLVTLTVGAANLGLSRVLAACANPVPPNGGRMPSGDRPSARPVGGLSGRQEFALQQSHRPVCRRGG